MEDNTEQILVGPWDFATLFKPSAEPNNKVGKKEVICSYVYILYWSLIFNLNGQVLCNLKGNQTSAHLKGKLCN